MGIVGAQIFLGNSQRIRERQTFMEHRFSSTQVSTIEVLEIAAAIAEHDAYWLILRYEFHKNLVGPFVLREVIHTKFRPGFWYSWKMVFCAKSNVERKPLLLLNAVLVLLHPGLWFRPLRQILYDMESQLGVSEGVQTFFTWLLQHVLRFHSMNAKLNSYYAGSIGQRIRCSYSSRPSNGIWENMPSR